MTETVTVLMSVYKNADTVAAAINSVLSQTYTDFRFIIVLDGMDPASVEEVRKFSDPRIHLLEIAENIGLTRALNRGLSEVQTPFLARIDADDLWAEEKLQRDISYLVENSDVWMVAEGPHVTETTLFERRDPLFFIRNLAVHSSVVLRFEPDLRYDETFKYSQDYELWLRALRQQKKIVVGPLKHTTMGHSATQISKAKRSTQRKFALRAKFKHVPFRHTLRFQFLYQIARDAAVGLLP
jgi:hypothetical protein